jgi:hypothetical protein
MKTLRDWVGAVANDIAPELNEEVRERQEQVQLASMSRSTEPESSASFNESTMNPHGRVLTTTETDVRFLQKAFRANAHDAFDPARFNQQYGKPTRTENAAQAPNNKENMSDDTNEDLTQDRPLKSASSRIRF